MKPVRPKYQQIKEFLRDLAGKERSAERKRLPSEHELGRRFLVSRNTVRQALAELEQEGVVTRERGRGTYFSGRNGAAATRHFLIGIETTRSTCIYPDIVRGAERVLAASGYHLVVGGSASDSAERFAVGGSRRWRPDGHLFEPLNTDLPIEKTRVLGALRATGIPFVLLNWAVDDDISYVAPDDRAAGFAVGSHLAGNGHRRIAFVGLAHHLPSRMRLTGFQEHARRSGEDVCPDLVRWLETDAEAADRSGAYAATRSLLALGPRRPTAIFFYNDRTASYGYRAIRDAGLTIPGDVSVVGFDDSEISRALYPHLTTVTHPKEKLGAWAARLLLEQIEDPEGSLPVHILFPCRIVERDSVRNLV